MTKTAQTPGSVLQSFIDEYHINPFFLSKEIKLSYHTVLNILKGKGKITVPTAIRLGTYFDNTPAFWLDVQSSSEINELTSNKKFVSIIKSIPKAKKPTVKASAGTKAKPKSNTLSEKRKKAAKVPGARAARGKRTRT
jgi:addiction module HigA family antidote